MLRSRPLLLLAFLASSAMQGCARTPAAELAPADPVTTVLVVRHAERAAQPEADPVLTPEGEARARALLPIAREYGVSAVVITHLQRTRLTAQPTMDALGIVPTVIRAGGSTHAHEVARAVLEDHRGSAVLVVGHSNTVAGIVRALGGESFPNLCDDQYDTMFIVRIPAAGVVRTTRTTYGTRTPARAGCAGM